MRDMRPGQWAILRTLAGSSVALGPSDLMEAHGITSQQAHTAMIGIVRRGYAVVDRQVPGVYNSTRWGITCRGYYAAGLP